MIVVVGLKFRERKSGRPFIYFRGSMEDARGLSDKELRHAFESGFGTNASLFGRFKVGAFRKELLAQMQELVRQPSSLGNWRAAVLDTPHGPLAFKLTHSRGRFFVHALPLSHFVTSRGIKSSVGSEPFEDLASVIRHGLKSGQPLPWLFHYPNVNVQGLPADRVNFWYGAHSSKPGLEGDMYGVEFFATQDRRDVSPKPGGRRVVSPIPHAGMVHAARPEGLRRVHVLTATGLEAEDVIRRHAFYEKRFGAVPFALHVRLDGVPIGQMEEFVRKVQAAVPSFRLRWHRGKAPLA